MMKARQGEKKNGKDVKDKKKKYIEKKERNEKKY